MKKLMMTCVLAICAAVNLSAMPTKEETAKAEPVVRKLLENEHAALRAGKKTRTEVADAAMKLTREADTDAAKLLLMKGAFVLYVKDGKLEKAVEAMNMLEAAIADMPQQSVTNMIELALMGLPGKTNRTRLYQLLDGTKKEIPVQNGPEMTASKVKDRTTIKSIIDGMIKVPGRDYWLSETELTQGQWEAVMGYNFSSHKGVNLPVENVSRDDCDVFLEKLNQTKEVKASQFEFRLPELEEWKYAAWAGSAGAGSWIKPGVMGDVRDMAWVKENSSNETHAVATKAPNAFGFYDMMGNVWEWLAGYVQDPRWKGNGALKGCAFHYAAVDCIWNQNWYLPRNDRRDRCGMRLAAQRRASRLLAGSQKTSASPLANLRSRRNALLNRRMNQAPVQQQERIDDYTWSYTVNNGEATITAVSPAPKGQVTIPSTLGGAKVTGIGRNAFLNCREMTTVTIPNGVRNIGNEAFCDCHGLASVVIPEGVTNLAHGAFGSCGSLSKVKIPSTVRDIGEWAFHLSGLTSVTVPEGMTNIRPNVFRRCGKLTSVTIPSSVKTIGCWAFSECNGLTSVTITDGVASIEGAAFWGCRGMKSVKIPASVTSIGDAAFSYCSELKEIVVADGNQKYVSVDNVLYSKDRTELTACPNGLDSVKILPAVKIIRADALEGCAKLKSVAIPDGVTSIGVGAFKRCDMLASITIPASVKDIGDWAFTECGALKSMTLPNGVEAIGFAAFHSCHGLKSVTVPASVVGIGGAAFSYCHALRQINVAVDNQKYTSVDGVLYTKDRTELVSFPKGLDSVRILPEVKNIGSWAFESATALTSVTIPEGVTNLAYRAFLDCNGLTSVTIPGSVETIGRDAFWACRGLKTVTISSRVKNIEPWAFHACSELVSVTMLGERPDSQNNIFNACGKLKVIRVPANAKSWAGMEKWHGVPIVRREEVDGYIWSYSIENGGAVIGLGGDNPSCAVYPIPTGYVTIPSTLGGKNVTGIGRKAFLDCREMTAVTIPDGVKNIGDEAFCECHGLASVVIPEGVTSIGGGVFKLCDRLTSVKIPASVKSIGDWAFVNCGGLKSVTLPDGVETIGFGAFHTSGGLESVTIPASVTSIGRAMVAYSSKLKRINVAAGNKKYTSIDGVLYTKDRTELWACPNGLESVKIVPETRNIGPWAFEGCMKLKSVTIPEGVTNIEYRAFNDCNALTSVTIPGSVGTIGHDAFKDCHGLKSVTIMPGVKNIGPWAFVGCDKLASVTIPKSVTKIDNNAFEACGDLESLNLPEGLTSIGCDAFRGLVKMSELTIPASVTNVAGAICSFCTGLGQIKVAADNPRFTSIDGVLYTKDLTELKMCPDGLTSVKIPEGVICIGHGAFAGCARLKEVSIPANVRNIEAWAFQCCKGVTSMIIPESVANIGWRAFSDCRGLTSVTMLGECPAAPSNIFSGCVDLKSIHVPKNSQTWSKMKDWCGIPLVFDGKDAAEEFSKAKRAMEEKIAAEKADKLYCVIDLSCGPDAKNYTVSYLDSVPKTGWTDEYKTTKLVLRKIQPGSFEYEPGRSFKITKPFYAGVFEVTQKQYELVTGKNPSEYKGDMRPVEKISYRDLRGAEKGEGWPKNDEVDDGTFLGLLRKRAGLHVDLPTEVQWEYACRAGTKGEYNVDGVPLVKLCKYADNGGRIDHHVVVGSFLPNAWGIYDMHGNVWEWCLDRAGADHDDGKLWISPVCGWKEYPKERESDPRGPNVGLCRVQRGGNWNDNAGTCRSCVRAGRASWGVNADHGFRLTIQLPFNL